MHDLIIKGGSALIRENNQFKAIKTDIAMDNGRISQIGDLSSSSAKDEIDATGLHILPGVIDSQVHFREPGLEHKEDLESGTRGAVLGGVTAIFDMPNTRPSTDNQQAFESKMSAAADRAWCNFAFYVGATARNTNELPKLENLPGCCGIKIFMGSSTGDLLLTEDEIIEQIFKTTKRTIALHCEDEERLVERKHIAIEGKDPKFHPLWRDEMTALKATQRVLAICEKTKRKAHVLHITTKEEIELLAKNKHLVSVECLPQHLTLTAPECYEKSSTYAQMNPPIRERHHKDALWVGIENNTVDVLGSDHAPHTKEEKQRTYPNSPSGLTGVQTILPLMLNHVNEGKLSLSKLVELLCYNPAQLFKIKNKGELKVGFDADITIVNLNKETTITNDWIASKSGWTTFDGMKVKGWPTHTIIQGKTAMAHDKLVNKALGKPIQFTDV